jgi:hypothetical protein
MPTWVWVIEAALILVGLPWLIWAWVAEGRQMRREAAERDARIRENASSTEPASQLGERGKDWA